ANVLITDPGHDPLAVLAVVVAAILPGEQERYHVAVAFHADDLQRVVVVELERLPDDATGFFTFPDAGQPLHFLNVRAFIAGESGILGHGNDIGDVFGQLVAAGGTEDEQNEEEERGESGERFFRKMLVTVVWQYNSQSSI